MFFFVTYLLYLNNDKSTAQVALRFLIQNNVVVIPKSSHLVRMIENINVFDFALDDADMAMLQALDQNQSLFFAHDDPKTVEMVARMHR